MNFDNYKCEGQTTIFDYLPTNKEKIPHKIKILSLFSGIGAFEKALDRLEVDYELIGFSEIDKYATKSYCAIHDVPESMNLGDITKIDEKALPKDIDLVTYGFPCQDISLAGKQKGLFNEDGTQTRSGLFFEALRLIEATQPRVAIAENVKNLTSKKFSEQFKIVLDSLEEAGYNNHYKILNSKDFGIPQNRERVFIVSIRKDIDTGCFRFPEGFPLELRLKDMLEETVGEQFYLSNVQIDKLHIKSKDALVYDKSMLGFENNAREYNDIMPTITSREWKEPRVVNESRLNEINMLGLLDIKGNEQVRRVYGTDGIAPTLNTMQGGNRQPKIAVSEPTIQRVDIPQTVKVRKYDVDCNLLCECLRDHKNNLGFVGHGVAQTLTTSPQQGAVVNDLRIRKLTPKECFRLQDFDDSDFAKAEAVNSNTQLYKQAGNSITVAVPYYIFKALFDANIL